jgi:hypothetical protein
MSETQPLVFPDHDYPSEHAHNIVLTTSNNPALATRVATLGGTMAELRAEISGMNADYAQMNADLLAEREARTNAQIERDALAQAVIDCDRSCTAEDWAALVETARRFVGGKAA